MRVVRGFPVILTAAAFLLTAGPALAQGTKKPSKRDAAISACVEQVSKDTGVTSGDPMQRRIAAWKACMQSQGQRP